MSKKRHQKTRGEMQHMISCMLTKAKAIYDLTEFVEPRELSEALRFLQREMDNYPADHMLKAQFRLLAAFARFKAKLFHEYLD